MRSRSTMVRAFILACVAAIAGCSTARSSAPYSPQAESQRDGLRAQRLNQEASALMDKDRAKAERLLREALTADLYYGPAHNNLGVLYLKQDKLYEASAEFEWAKKLMPGHPDPRMNLALTLEKAGRTEEALAGYRGALEVYPDHLATLQAMSRLQIRSGKTDQDTRRSLEQVALRGESGSWREWARRELAKLSR